VGGAESADSAPRPSTASSWAVQASSASRDNRDRSSLEGCDDGRALRCANTPLAPCSTSNHQSSQRPPGRRSRQPTTGCGELLPPSQGGTVPAASAGPVLVTPGWPPTCRRETSVNKAAAWHRTKRWRVMTPPRSAMVRTRTESTTQIASRRAIQTCVETNASSGVSHGRPAGTPSRRRPSAGSGWHRAR
jgi:hypothetical protein